MNISRRCALAIHYVLDMWVPPAIRDTKWFMYIPFKLLFRDKADIFFTFKERAFRMSEEEFAQTYRDVEPVLIKRETALNSTCLRAVLRDTIGNKVLDVGCGTGYLAGLLSQRHTVTACDIAIGSSLPRKYPSVTFVRGNAERLPFANNAFDTVVCTHTLEHVRDLPRALTELRRVARKRLIVVVPKQRPYKYTFDLHLHFFPAAHALHAAFGVRPRQLLQSLGGDWFYTEDIG
jgi:ubiquinone/menaquinone biosynthesis C-methylase UbiE